MNTKARTFWVLIALAGLCLFGLEAGAQVKVTMSSTAGGAVGLITDVAKAQKYDEKNGIALEVKLFDPAKAEEMVFFRNVDAGLFPVISAGRANLKGGKVRIFGPLLWNHMFLLVPKDSPYRKVEDLRGKKVGSLARISGLYTSFQTVLRMTGMDFDKDFKVILGAPLALLGFFEKGDVDATLHYEPFVSRYISEGKAREIASINEMWRRLTGQPMLTIGLAAYEDWINKDVDRAKRLARTMADSISYIKANADKAIEDHRKAQGIRSDAEAELLKKRYPIVFPDRWDAEIVANAAMQLKKNVEYGLLEKMPEGEIFIIMK